MLFEDKIESIIDELSLAIKWDRPSILVAVYQSENVRWDAEVELTDGLKQLGQDVYHLKVSKEQFDIPLVLSLHPKKETTVFFVSGINWGGGQWGRNTYKTLNLRREFFVDHHLRVLLWLTKEEAENLPRRSPDFWAFRHRVFEFTELISSTDHGHAFISKPIWDDIPDVTLQEVNEMIVLREELLASLPETQEAHQTRLELFYHLAALYQKKGDHKKSLEMLEDGLALSTELSDLFTQRNILLGLGTIYFDLGRLNEARTAFQKAMDLDPKNLSARINLSVIQLHQAQPVEAIETAEQAITIDRHNAMVWYHLGNLHFDLGNFQEALRTYKRCIRLDPSESSYWFQLGLVYRFVERNKDAIHAFNKAKGIDPAAADPWINLSLIYRDMGRYTEAAHKLSSALESDPKNASARILLGHLNVLMENHPEAKAEYQQALEVDNKNTEAHISIAALHLKEGNETEAGKHLEEAKKRMSTLCLYLQACYHAVSGDIEKATDLLTLAIERQRFLLPWALKDPRLDRIRASSRYQTLLDQFFV
ncbi:MAG: tetratricopeptide repeat protein [Anaerolineales bacterium]|nr:tetratricopeptide repeat protein [Anaerolineales bacterium]